MFIFLNIYFLMLLGCIAGAVAAFCYALSQPQLRPKAGKPMPIVHAVVFFATLAVPISLTMADAFGLCAVPVKALASAWACMIDMGVCQALLYGCTRVDAKSQEHVRPLTLLVFTDGMMSAAYATYWTFPFGTEMLPTYFAGDMLQQMLDVVLVLMIWMYIRVIANLNSGRYRTITRVFCGLTALACAAIASDPVTNFTIAVDPAVQGTVYRPGFAAVMAAISIILVAEVTLVARMKLGREERTSLLLLAISAPVAFGIYLIFGGISTIPLLIAIGCLGCYLGITVGRVKESARHYAQVDVARAIQQGTLPASHPNDPRFDLAARMWPAKEVAGDFYDYYQPDPDTIYITVADVSGKDVPAAMFMSRAHALIRTHEKEGLPPDQILNKVNKALAEGNSEKLFVTVWIGRITLSKGVMIYANAGHNPPVVTRPGAGSYYLRTKANLMAGIRKKTTYARHSALLKRGDRILLYTDGVTEAINRHEEQFGEDRLQAFCEKTAAWPVTDVPDELFAKVGEFSQGMEQFDDVTVLYGEFTGDPLGNAQDYAEEIFLAETDQLGAVNDFVEAAALRMGYPEDHLMKLEMCLEEAFVNVCHYAYASQADQGKVRVEVMRHGDAVHITLADTGAPFDPLAKEAPDFEERARKKTVGGLGIYLIRKFMDDVSYAHVAGENRLTLVKTIQNR